MKMGHKGRSRLLTHLTALAAGAALLLTGGAPSVLAERSATVVKVMQGMQEIRAVKKTGYLVVQDGVTGLWGVCDSRGRLLLPFDYQELSWAGYGCFISSMDTDPLMNAKALIGPGGQSLSGYQYGAIRVYNGEWAVGWTVSGAYDTDYDYKTDAEHFYYYNQCDIYRLGDAPHLVCSLERSAFAKAAVHGQYLSVEDRAGKVTVYGPDGAPADYTPAKAGEALYGVVSYTLVDKVTGEAILDGVTDAKETAAADGEMLFRVTRTGYDGKKQGGLFSLSGQWLIPLGDYTVTSVEGTWAVISKDGKQGLYSLERGRLMLPCEFDSVISSGQTVDPYLFYGYLCAEKEGVRYAMDVATGEIVAAYEWDEKHMKPIGGSALYQDFGKKSLISATGSRTTLAGYQPQESGGDGRLVVVKGDDNRCGVVTYEGQLLLETHYLVPPVITPEDAIILNTKNGWELLNVYW